MDRAYNKTTMLNLVLVLAMSSPATADTYEVTEVIQHKVFAGKLGDRVTEELVLKSGSETVTVQVSGFYHTRCTHRGQRIGIGDKLTLAAGATRVNREQVRKVR